MMLIPLKLMIDLCLSSLVSVGGLVSPSLHGQMTNTL